jgi:hypothetical protein
LNSKEALRELLAWGTEEPRKEILATIIDNGVCPTQFPDFKQNDCRPLRSGEKGHPCVLCWYEALYDKRYDEVF